MHVLIVASGRISGRKFYSKIIRSADKIIAADGGADNCIRFKIQPDYVTGDFDSISANAKEKFKELLINDKSQKTTDLEKSINFAKKLGCTKITIVGAIGSRLDHTISNIMALSKIKVPSEIINESNTVYVVQKEISLKGKKGDVVSVIPISDVKGLTYEGLKWPVKNKNVGPGWIGVSNQMSGSSASISLKSGKIIVMKSRD